MVIVCIGGNAYEVFYRGVFTIILKAILINVNELYC